MAKLMKQTLAKDGTAAFQSDVGYFEVVSRLLVKTLLAKKD
jgi:hypothetical protein